MPTDAMGEPRSNATPADSADGGSKAAEPLKIHMPAPSIWPVLVAAGVTFLMFGILSHWAFSVLGAVLLFGALARWIGEMRHDA